MSSKRVVPRLLAGRDRLGRIEKDSIFESVLAEIAPPRRSRWWLGLAVPVLAAGLVLVLAPWRSDRAGPEELAARGAGQAVATLHVTCSGACTHGDKLMFDVHGTRGYPYFAAFARRADGTVLWYFPASPDEVSAALSSQAPTGVLDRSIVIGAEHAPGTYAIYGVFSAAPLTRATIRDRFDEPHHNAGPDTAVMTTDLVVR